MAQTWVQREGVLWSDIALSACIREETSGAVAASVLHTLTCCAAEAMALQSSRLRRSMMVSIMDLV